MILPLVLSSHEEATVRCAKARPGSNSSTGSKAPVRLTTSGPHVLAKLSKLDPVFIDRCDARGVMQNSSHLISFSGLGRRCILRYSNATFRIERADAEVSFQVGCFRCRP